MNQQADRYSAEYVIRIREPMNKFSKQTITTAIIEKVFPKVDINAKLPVGFFIILKTNLFKGTKESSLN